MKKIILFLLILVILVIGCKSYQAKNGIVAKSPKTLSEMQVTACNTADEARTCDTRLAELGIVLKEDCCKSLGKCC